MRVRDKNLDHSEVVGEVFSEGRLSLGEVEVGHVAAHDVTA